MKHVLFIFSAGLIFAEQLFSVQLTVKVFDTNTSAPTLARASVKNTDGTFWTPSVCGEPKEWITILSSLFGNMYVPISTETTTSFKDVFNYTDLNGTLSGDVSPGTYIIKVQKGTEYTPFEKTITVASDTIVVANLSRWIDMVSLGWYSGEPHVHAGRTGDQDARILFPWIKAEDLNVLCVLYGTGASRISQQQEKYGPAGESCADNKYLITSGNEYRNCFAHVSFINSDECPTFHFQGTTNLPPFQPNYLPSSLVEDWVRSRGGDTIYLHGMGRASLLVDLATGRTNLGEVLQLNSYQGVKDWYKIDWYKILNAGYQLFGTSGSDAYEMNTVGVDRMYVYLQNNFTFTNWLNAAKEGHSFVTSGPVLLFTVDGKLPGEEIAKTGTATVRIKFRAAFCYPLEKVELIRNGMVAKTWTPSPGQLDWVIEEDFPVTQSCWLALRTNGISAPIFPMAHTNPVFITVNNMPVWNKSDNMDIFNWVKTTGSPIDWGNQVGLYEIAFSTIYTVGMGEIPGTGPISFEAKKELCKWYIEGLKKIAVHNYVAPGTIVDQTLAETIDQEVRAVVDVLGMFPAARLLVAADRNTFCTENVLISTITARLCDDNGLRVNNSTKTVTFTLSNSNGNLLGTNTVTTSGGIASIRYQSGTTPGTVVISATAPGLSSGTVTLVITSTSTISITAPNGGEFWISGTTRYVTWSLQGTAGTLNIDISSDGGVTWNNIASTIAAANETKSIIVPNFSSTACKVRLSDTGGSLSDTSDNNFTIQYPLQNQMPNPPFGLLCDGQNNPKELSSGNPLLSWTFSDPDTGDSQSAYQILLGDSLSNISSNIGNLWDSNKVNSNENTVRYSGSNLSAGTTCYWKVMTWDTSNAQGSYSLVASFTMGPSITQSGILQVSTTTLWIGAIEPGETRTVSFDIKNIGNGPLSGTISSNQQWAVPDSTFFSLNAQDIISVIVTIDITRILSEEGQYTATITIAPANESAQTVTLNLTATCVLVKPNPVRLSSPLAGEGRGEGSITFYGDGIVTGQTTIKIYSLSGELLDVIASSEGAWQSQTSRSFVNTQDDNKNEIAWQPSNLSPGIYIYVYESPKEKGVGKFTVVR